MKGTYVHINQHSIYFRWKKSLRARLHFTFASVTVTMTVATITNAFATKRKRKDMFCIEWMILLRSFLFPLHISAIFDLEYQNEFVSVHAIRLWSHSEYSFFSAMENKEEKNDFEN